MSALTGVAVDGDLPAGPGTPALPGGPGWTRRLLRGASALLTATALTALLGAPAAAAWAGQDEVTSVVAAGGPQDVPGLPLVRTS